MERKYDLILFGATGFTGRLVAEYLWKQYGRNGHLRWAIAARNREKLEAINTEISQGQISTEIADLSQQESLNDICRKAHTICTTIGPYSISGAALVEACVDNKTHYCDLSGEVTWMRKMIDQFHDQACEGKVRIVHACGFDSIPSDIGVWYIQEEFKKKYGAYAEKVSTGVKAMRGGFSGGTFASLSEVMKTASEEGAMKKVLFDPHGLDPSDQRGTSGVEDVRAVKWNEPFESWIAPFIMSSINTRIVRRSNALLGFPYGKAFEYEEFSLMGRGLLNRLKAWIMTLVLGLLMSARPGSLMQRIIKKWAPKPGEGPSKEERENGFWVFDFHAVDSNGANLKARVKGDKDPGYGSTAKMLGEAAVCLCKDELTPEYGILTPASAMGKKLYHRLKDNAGLTFKIKP